MDTNFIPHESRSTKNFTRNTPNQVGSSMLCNYEYFEIDVPKVTFFSCLDNDLFVFCFVSFYPFFSLFWCVLVVLKGVCYNVHLFQVFCFTWDVFLFCLFCMLYCIYCQFLYFEVGYMNYWESLYLRKLVFIVVIDIKFMCPTIPDRLCSIVF